MGDDADWTQACLEGNTLSEDPETARDAAFILDMLLPFYGPIENDPLPDGRDKRTYGYTCKHFDGADCTQYADRPKMCRDYPYGRSCGKPGCTYEPDVLISRVRRIPEYITEE
jgi:Fe-S-cluster containining protein